MGQILNTATLREARLATKMALNVDAPIQTVQPNVVPVVEINPKLLRPVRQLGWNNRTTSGSGTIFTTDSVKDTFITGVELGFVKDATSDIAKGAISITSTDAEGLSIKLASTPILTTTAERSTHFVSFPQAIKLGKGVAVTINLGTFTVGNASVTSLIVGYTQDPES